MKKKKRESDFSTEDIRQMAKFAELHRIPPIICEDCGEGFYFMYFGNTKKYPSAIVAGEDARVTHLRCYHHITQDVAVAAVAGYHDINWN